MSETRIELDAANGALVVEEMPDGSVTLWDDLPGHDKLTGICSMSAPEFDRLAMANPRVRDLLDAALDSLAAGVIAAGLDDAVAPFVVARWAAIGREAGGWGR